MKNLLFSITALLLLSVAFPVKADSQLAYDTALRDSILRDITGAHITGGTYSVMKYGAKPDGITDCRKAFHKAIDAAVRKGGGTIEVPAGTYYIKGPLNLQSHICINLAEGAVLKFAPDPDFYPVVPTGWEGTYLYNISPFIYGHSLTDVAITGSGTIDGNAMTTFATWRPDQKPAQQRSRDYNHRGVPVEERRFDASDRLRPHLLQLYDCTRVTLSGVKIINSPFWCIHLLQCDNVVCRSLRYDAKLVNNDGIDPESSSNVLIEDVWFDNGDDNIAIKSGRDNDGWTLGRPCENIIIRGCHFKGLHAVVIGSEMSGGVRNVFIEDCDHAGYCKRGVYVKTNPDRGGFVDGLYVRNVTLGDVEDLFYVTSRYAGEGLDNHHFSEISRIVVDGLQCSSASKAALVLQGTPARPIRDVFFDNIRVPDGDARISFTDTERVSMGRCIIGVSVDVPTQVSHKDKIFNR